MIDKALSIIKGASILNSSDSKAITEMHKELMHTFETVQVFRTKTEMRVSVLKDTKHPTPDAKYWQATREQNAMFQELVMLSYNYRKHLVEIKILERDYAEESDVLEKELLVIEKEKKQFVGSVMRRTAKARIQEIIEWSAIKKELIPHLKYGVKNVDLHQLDAMKQRFNFEANQVNSNTAIADKINIFGKAMAVNKATS